jgi:hypothetical protein
MDKAMQLRTNMPGFDPIWLWEATSAAYSWIPLDVDEQSAADEESLDRVTVEAFAHLLISSHPLA